MKIFIKYFALIFFFNACSSQSSKIFESVSKIEKSTINTKEIDSIFFNVENNIIPLNESDKNKFLKATYFNKTDYLKTYLIAYSQNDFFYSLFIKVIIGDSQSEIIMVNIDKYFSFIDSKVVHGGFFAQPEELDNGDVKWANKNYSIIENNNLTYFNVEIFSNGFEEDAKEWSKIKETKYIILKDGSINNI